MELVKVFDCSILLDEPEVVAPRLLGCHLVRTVNGRTLRGVIVETEAYKQSDAASHSYGGKTPRVDVMFGRAGRLYVYFTYGMHYCCNVVVGSEGYGAAVLIRAVEPVEGEEDMRVLRAGRSGHELTNGPAKVCQAFAIDKAFNGHDLAKQPLQLEMYPPIAQDQIVQTARIGITKAIDQPWRFYLKDNPYVFRR